MILTLAFRNLFHDRVRLAVTLVGILFSIVLVAIQLGLYLGASRMITANIDNARADLWITAFGAKSFEDGGLLLSSRERHQALATPGVAAVVPVVVKFSEWRKPAGGSTRVVIVGADAEEGAVAPLALVTGTWQDIKAPDAIAVDRTYLADLGITGIGDTAQIDIGRVRVRALTDGVRSFTQSPYVYMPLARARHVMGAPGTDLATFHLIQLEPGADLERVRADLKSRLETAEVLTTSEFRDRSLNQWLFRTGAGVALIGGALLGILVGTVIVAQTLYSSTKDHINEFATLRALGSSSGYIHQVILAQAGLSAVIGYGLGMMIALLVVMASQSTPLPIVMTPGLAAGLFTVTLFMCAISAISAIVKVTKIDPATVFSR
ncbi:MAG: ABC transporter permease [Hyphomicrobiaceae bacterium]|nr:ABC transporter permease [Hyphomicrobiaceae bacterium]